ncbi:hypothetical protein KP748_01530 [Streptococcus equi subsp. zooepidemicus]|nr:hypothetical protein [Streptococcus equi subsp. zooepidemicus]
MTIKLARPIMIWRDDQLSMLPGLCLAALDLALALVLAACLEALPVPALDALCEEIRLLSLSVPVLASSLALRLEQLTS